MYISYITVAVLVATGGMLGYATASSDSITFIEYPDGVDALRAVGNGTLDMHTNQITLDLTDQALRDPNIRLVDAAGTSLYTLDVNPAMGESFNPFSIREVRYALNYLLDRDQIIQNGLDGSGTTILSGIYPLHPDYPLVYRQLDELNISYDPILADIMISRSLLASGAYKTDGIWHYDDNPISVTITASEYPISVMVSDMIKNELEKIGFIVERINLDLAESFNVVYGSDPAHLEWHLHAEAYGGFAVNMYRSGTLAGFYAPWAGNMPGSGNPDYWNYENRLLDDTTYAIYAEEYESVKERTHLVRVALSEGVNEAVRLFVAVENARFLVNYHITDVVSAPGVGLITRYNTLNAYGPGSDLTIGTKYITQSAWNPVGGFRDTDTIAIWDVLHDPLYSNNPFTGDLIPVRAQWGVLTDASAGEIAMPHDAVMWNPSTHTWETSPRINHAVTRVTFDLDMSNWHSGASMDINDIMYPLYFLTEHMTYHEGHEHDTAVTPRPSSFVDELRGVRILDDDTIEVYTDYSHQDIDQLVRFSALWSSIPWDVYAAMEAAALYGKTAFEVSDAQNKGISWLSMLDANDTLLLREYLQMFVDTRYIPEGLYTDISDEYVLSRYNSTISWIDAMGHSVISNGPYYLDAYWPENGTLRVVSFDDDTYPIEPDHWKWLVRLGELDDTVQIGSLAPLTGGADRYGKDIAVASALAVADFNAYLEKRGDQWRLESVSFDSMTNPDVILQHLQTLEERGIGIVNGPAIDLITDEMLQFADDHNMILLSCCSSVPSLAIEDDALFRLLPDQTMHGETIARLMYEDGIKAIAPVGIDGGWAGELLDATMMSFHNMGGDVSDSIKYVTVDEFDARSLAEDIIQLLDNGHRIDQVAVLYIGYGEAPQVMMNASGYNILEDVKWFGADQNTAWPNVLDSAQATAFAQKVEFTVVQPSVPDDTLEGSVYSKLSEYLGAAPSPYAMYEYDTIWLLGLSIRDSQSTDPGIISAALPEVASRYVGLIGSTHLNRAGDLVDTNYAVWTIQDGIWRLADNDY